MSNRHDEMTLFLKHAYELKIKNPNNFNEKNIYKLLESYDVDRSVVFDDKDESYFSYFKTYFSNNHNINVAINPSEPEFLKLSNSLEPEGMDYIKMYINPSKSGYCNVALKIFNFLASHPEIKHWSKISKNLRSDRIVVRVKELKDAKILYDFINNDEYIKNNLNKANPFTMRCGDVGFAYDYLLSFNGFISHLIYEYINSNIDLNSISSDSFRDFVGKQFDDIVYNGYDYKIITSSDETKVLNKEVNFSKQVSFNEYINLTQSEILAKNYGRLKTIHPSIKFNDAVLIHLYLYDEFYSLYDENNIDNIKRHDKTESIYIDLDDKYNLYKARETINSYIKYIYAKEQDIEYIVTALNGFTTFGSENMNERDKALRYITRDNGYRTMFVNITSDQVYRITGAGLYEYVENIVRESYINDYESSARTS